MVERLSVGVGANDLNFETGRIAKQAHGAVLVTMGDTMVLAAVCVSSEIRPGQDFFPLTVDYREKSASAGKIPGNFFRREGRPSEREILVCRLTDRPLRPLFPKGFKNEVQVSSTVFSADNENNPDVMSINAASAALHISKIPFDGPIGAVRVGLIAGELVVNPKMNAMAESRLDLVMAGTKDAILMVEGAAKDLPEDMLLEALELGHRHIQPICEAIEELRNRVGEAKIAVEVVEPDPKLVSGVESIARDRLYEALRIGEKRSRQEAMDALTGDMFAKLGEEHGGEFPEEDRPVVWKVFDDLVKEVMRDQVLSTSIRIDGRRPEEIRPITIELGVLPRAHGSCLFTRGETQALISATLGTSRDEQRLDELTGEEFKRFMLHYNFPPWSVGEVRPMRGPSRRDIGHGKLAERALDAVMPFANNGDAEAEAEESAFPYTVRVVSDITESNGSSSMATACGGTLSLMDAGVPIRTHVAGIAMGLIKEGDRACVLTDIMGAEDHLGDMDFKVCGTRDGITAFQMDIKVKGISSDLMKRALDQARAARLEILDKMVESLAEPRPEISPYAPRIYTIQIPVDKIRDIIGPGGKVIREIQLKTGAEIDIQDDGTINVAAVDEESATAAIDLIRDITAEPEVGQVYTGRVSRIMPFGAFVAIMGGKEGLVHISELAPRHVREVEDVVHIGDEVSVKVVEIDKMGRVNLSKVEADRELGLIDDDEYERHRSERGDRGDRPREHRDGGRGGDRPRGGRNDRRGGGGRGGDRGGSYGGRGRR